MITLLCYFLGGFILDIIVVYYYYALHDKHVLLSFILTFLLGVFQTLALYFIIVGVDYILNTIIYSLGCATGSALIVYFKKRKNVYKI
jgi:hypothetical protein